VFSSRFFSFPISTLQCYILPFPSPVISLQSYFFVLFSLFCFPQTWVMNDFTAAYFDHGRRVLRIVTTTQVKIYFFFFLLSRLKIPEHIYLFLLKILLHFPDRSFLNSFTFTSFWLLNYSSE